MEEFEWIEFKFERKCKIVVKCSNKNIFYYLYILQNNFVKVRRVILLGTLNGMKFRSGRQSMRQKARVLHEPSHKVDLCDADRNCKISTFTWNEPTQLWSYAVDYEILVMHLFGYNTRGKRVSNFFCIPWNYLTESKNLTSRFSRFEKIICIMIKL